VEGERDLAIILSISIAIITMLITVVLLCGIMVNTMDIDGLLRGFFKSSWGRVCYIRVTSSWLGGGGARCGLEPVDKMNGENYGFIVCMSMEEWRLGYLHVYV
jgi:hypothetical protein